MTDPVAPDEAPTDAPPSSSPSRPRLPDATGAAVGGFFGIILSTGIFAALLFAVIKTDDVHPIFFFLVMVGGSVFIPLATIACAALGGHPDNAVTLPPAGATGVGGQTSVAIPGHTRDDVVPPAGDVDTTNTIER